VRDTVGAMALTGELVDIESGPYRATLSEVGAGLAGSWFAESMDRSRALTSPWPVDALPRMGCGAVLMPWPNRIRNGRYHFDGVDYQLALTEAVAGNAIHGLARWVRWTIAEVLADRITFALDLVPQPGYPFELSLQVSYLVDASDGLTVTGSAVNRGNRAAPFAAGFHPYIDLRGMDYAGVEVDIPVGTMLHTDGQQIPVSREPVDGTPFQLSPRRQLGDLRVDHGFGDLTGNRAQVYAAGEVTEVWWDAQFRFLQVFTPPVERFGKPALAIEPMTAAPNAFNDGGFVALQPGDRWSGSWGVLAVS
jgi:aldose 1-epimerase